MTTDELIIFIYNNEFYYQFLNYIIIPKQKLGQEVITSNVDVRRGVFSKSIFCNNFVYKKSQISCLLTTEMTIFYELVLDISTLSTQDYALIHNYITPYNKYIDFEIEKAVVTSEFLIIQGIKSESGFTRSMLLFLRQTEAEKTQDLHYALNQSLYCDSCQNPVEVYLEAPDTFIMRTQLKNQVMKKIRILENRQFGSNITIPITDYKYYNVVLTYPGDTQRGLNSSISLYELMTEQKKEDNVRTDVKILLLGGMLFLLVIIILWVYFFEDSRDKKRIGKIMDIMNYRVKKSKKKKRFKVKGSVAILTERKKSEDSILKGMSGSTKWNSGSKKQIGSYFRDGKSYITAIENLSEDFNTSHY